MTERVEQIREAVEAMHGCVAAWSGHAPVREMMGERVVWEGVVEIFDLTGHPKASRCYAWSYKLGEKTKFVGVLETPPVKDPLTAVRAAIKSGQV